MVVNSDNNLVNNNDSHQIYNVNNVYQNKNKLFTSPYLS